MPDETQNNQAGTPPTGNQPGPSSPDGKGSTSGTPKSYTEADIQKAVSDALAKAGRERLSAIEAEKTQYQSRISESEEKIKSLEAQIDTISENNPNARELVNLRRELEKRQGAIESERQAIETDRTTHAERIKRAEELERKEFAAEIAGAYEGGDAQKLLNAGASTREQMDKIAATFWAKKPAPEGNQPAGGFRADSGVTSGGQDPAKRAREAFIANPYDPKAWADYQKHVLKQA